MSCYFYKEMGRLTIVSTDTHHMISVTTNSLPFEEKKGVGGIRSVDSVGLGRTCSVQVH